MMAVAGIGIAVNAATALLFMRGREHDLNIRGAFLHMVADALVSAGVVIAGALSLWISWTWMDPAVSLAIGAVILVGTWGMFKESLHLLFDGVPESVNPLAVRQCLIALPGVADVSDLHIWAVGTSQTVLTAHLVMPQGGADDHFLELATDALHDRFDITHVTLQTVSKPFQTTCNPLDGGPAGNALGYTGR
jgi:cobalt-zinc-cadmium efflux system protein